MSPRLKYAGQNVAVREGILAKMAALRAAMHAETGVANDETLQMFFRLGYAADPGPSSRRALDSFVKS